MPNLLKDLRINTIGSVDKPANQDAVIVLCKRNDLESEDSKKAKSDELFDREVADIVSESIKKGGEEPSINVDKIGRKINMNRLGLLKQIQAMLAELIADTEVGTSNKTQKNQGRDDYVAIAEDVMKALSAEAQSYIAELEKKSGLVDELTTKVTELEKNIEAKTEESVDIWKGVHPDIRKQFEDMQKKAEEAEKVAKAEKEKREWSELVKRTSIYSNVASAEELAILLKQAYATSQEHGEKLEAVFKATNERIAQGDLFKESGRSSSDSMTGTGAWAKIEAKASGLIEKSDKMTKEQAIAKVLELEPQLYTEYENERINRGVI